MSEFLTVKNKVSCLPDLWDEERENFDEDKFLPGLDDKHGTESSVESEYSDTASENLIRLAKIRELIQGDKVVTEPDNEDS